MIYLNNNRFLLNDFKTFKDRDQKKIDKTKLINIISDKLEIPNSYTIFNINNIYEAYAAVIHAIIFSYSTIRKPHIICNKMEPPAILDILESYVDQNKVIITFIKPDINGNVSSKNISKSITKNTCLIINSFINNMTSSIQDIRQISLIAHGQKIPVFCDYTYSFGKLPIDLNNNNMDVFTFTMDYPGLSFIVIKNDFLHGYNLPMYSTTFNEKIAAHFKEDPYIYGLGASIIQNLYKSRNNKNNKLYILKKYLLDRIDHITYKDLVELKKSDKKCIYFNGGENSAPHILSFLLLKKKKMDNGVKLCDMNSRAASALGITDKWKNCVITIGLSDLTTKKDIDTFIKNFIES